MRPAKNSPSTCLVGPVPAHLLGPTSPLVCCLSPMLSAFLGHAWQGANTLTPKTISFQRPPPSVLFTANPLKEPAVLGPRPSTTAGDRGLASAPHLLPPPLGLHSDGAVQNVVSFWLLPLSVTSWRFIRVVLFCH